MDARASGAAAPRSAVPGLLVFVGLLALFLAYRWWMRVEPLNSDDLTLFEIGVEAARGEHWLFQARPDGAALGHQALRIGMLPFLVPAVWILGPTQAAFYGVPLLFAALGFALVFRVLWTRVGPGAAVPLALLHVALPFELIRSSVLLVDLPSAVFVLAALWAVHAFAGDAAHGDGGVRTGGVGSVLGRAALPAALGLEAYLLRSNSLALLAPGLAVLFLTRRTRWVAFAAGATVLVGVGLEQLLYASKGLGVGFRFAVVSGALDDYAPFLPRYEAAEFATRVFRFAWSAFGGGWEGAFALGFYLLALAAHAGALARARSPLVRAWAATGLVAFGVFAYSTYEVTDGQVHALAPPNFRYYQIFFYTSLLALGWAGAGLWRGVAGRPAARLARGGLAVATGGAVLAVFAMSARHVEDRLLDPQGQVRRLVCALDRAVAATPGPATIVGTPLSVREAALFRGAHSRPAVHWQRLALPALDRALAEGAPLVFLDAGRTTLSARYQEAGAARERYEADLGSVLRRLWSEYALVWGRTGGAVYHRRAPGEPSAAPVALEPTWSATVPLRMEPQPAGGTRFVAESGTPPFYVYTGGGEALRRPPVDPGPQRIHPDAAYEIRLDLDLPEGAEANAFIVQYDARRQLGSERIRLRRGTNLLAFDGLPGAETFRLSLRVHPPGGGGIALAVDGLALRRGPVEPVCGGASRAAHASASAGGPVSRRAQSPSGAQPARSDS